MAELQAHYRISVDRMKPLAQEPGIGHNRWHPDIPPILRVREGEVVALETRDVSDGQIGPDTTIEEAARLSFSRIHPLTGPVWVEGAEPGDVLEIDILEIEPQPFGFTLQGPTFGFLRDILTRDHLVRWRIKDGIARSEDLPGVRIQGAPFMGVMGVAPSHELLAAIAQREADLAAKGGFVLLPNPEDAVPSDPVMAATALKTLPPREFGGNLDIKQLTPGTTLRLPVFVPGALFSAGDAHFAQGDNECCTAIETGATFTCRFRVIKGGTLRRQIAEPEFYRAGKLEAVSASQSFFGTTGFCRTNDGINHDADVTLSARNALLAMIRYLVEERGFTPEQSYALCSVCVDLRISQVVNLPNVLVSALLPLDIFDE
jgi:formamidase